MTSRLSRILLAGVFALGVASTVTVADAAERMGVVVKIGGIPWFNAMEAGIKQKAARNSGVNAFMVGPTSADPALQVRAVEDLIAQGVNVIGVVPNDARGAGAGAEARARCRHQGDHARVAQAEERRLELRAGLGSRLWRRLWQAPGRQDWAAKASTRCSSAR